MARFCTLFSGSSGNCTYIATPAGGILIDVGVSARRIEAALRERGIDLRSIRAIFLTHEHTDHIVGLRAFLDKYEVPVYGSAGTVDGVPGPLALLPQVMAAPVELDGLRVTSFHTPHDSRESTGYCIETADGRKLAVATDLGCVTDTVRQALTGCDLVLIESNHDERMLRNGRYPAYLKQRIASDTGHLSNTACAAELAGLVQSGTSRIVLGHLSRENNLPQMAYQTAKQALLAAGLTERRDYLLSVAAPVGTEAVTLF
ncbi:MAG: MBL fold metallo-hydrolase [Clostridia bacterium]|nr:MBL fold metallo-hydrolase [Clostridia bacterium]